MSEFAKKTANFFTFQEITVMIHSIIKFRYLEEFEKRIPRDEMLKLQVSTE